MAGLTKNSTEDRTNLGNFASKPVRILVSIVVCLVVLFPFYWLITSGLKTEGQYFADPPIMVPNEVTTEHFVSIFTKHDALLGLTNSLLIASITTAVTAIAGSMAAYTLINGALPAKLKGFFMVWFIIQRMYPAVVVAVPVFFVFQQLQLLDTIAALVIMNASFNIPLVLLLMMGFYSEAPYDIEEQAILDGCNLFQRFFWVTTPMVKTGIVAVAILTFIFTWNEFLFAVILTIRKATPITVLISGFVTDRGLEWGPMAAMACAVIFPVLIIMWVAQRSFVSGISAGALKM
ncbi:MAG: carbohydrate ABC transporter permease [Alkalispirochaetaceae bacterium]